MSYEINLRLDIQDILGLLSDTDREDAFEIIKYLDELVCDEEFTKRIRDYANAVLDENEEIIGERDRDASVHQFSYTYYVS